MKPPCSSTPIDIDTLLGPATEPLPGYYLHESGCLFDSDGPVLDMTAELVRFVDMSSRETWNKLFPFMRDYLAFKMPRDDDLPAIFSESHRAAVTRQRTYYLRHGWKLKTARAFDGAIPTRHDNAGYEKFRRLAVNKLYDIAFDAGARRDNPSLAAGWREANLQTRTSAAHLISNNRFDARHAGRQFLAPPVPTSTSIPVDPRECSAQLAEDLDRAKAPADVIDVDDVMDANGCRPFSVLTSTTFGWALAGLDDEFLARNKARGDELELRLVMPQQTLDRLRSRLAETRSASDPSRSLLSEIEQAAGNLAVPQLAKEAEAFLRSHPLFVCARTGAARTYEGARRHYIKGRKDRLAAREAAAEIGAASVPASGQRFSDGPRQPVMSDHRRCSITKDVFKVLEETKNEEERERRILRIAQNHGQSTDQSKRYANFAYMDEERKRRREELATKRQRLAELRSRAPAPAPPRFKSEDAQGQADFLAGRRD